jgi:hypothetical protein
LRRLATLKGMKLLSQKQKDRAASHYNLRATTTAVNLIQTEHGIVNSNPIVYAAEIQLRTFETLRQNCLCFGQHFTKGPPADLVTISHP